jgi:hypothetical protein
MILYRILKKIATQKICLDNAISGLEDALIRFLFPVLLKLVPQSLCEHGYVFP